jgi:hypothetical protein
LRTCATGVQAARRHSGEVAARRRSWMAARRQSGTPSAAAPRHAMDAGAPRPARIPLRAPAVAATDHGRRVPACGEREVRAACGGRGSMARTFGARAGQRRTGRAGEVDNFRLSPCSVVAHATV